jgi:hypothetical protein
MMDEIASMGQLEVDTKLHQKPSNLGAVVIILKWKLQVISARAARRADNLAAIC